MRTRVPLAVLLCATLAPAAHATWSIILIDTRSGEIGVASATCLTNFDLQANASVVVVGKGAGCAQSSVDTTGVNRTVIRDRLAQGVDPALILAELAATDPSHASRQYGIVDVLGRSITFTGVVQAALAAAQSTNGDLPARLQAAMEAAASFGGDGRCSCRSSGPTGCGSPPPNFTKSADIGYLIVSRLGDSDTSNGALTAGGTGLPAAADLTGDGRIDMLVPEALSTSQRFFVYPNTAPYGSVSANFGPGVEYGCVVNPLAAACADFNGDGRVDVAVCGGATTSGAPGAITFYRASPAGTLVNREDFATPRRVVGILAADVDGQNGPDVVFATGTQQFVRLNDGSGGFGPALVIGSLTNSGGLVAADLTGDGLPELIIGTGAASIRYLPNLGNGAFGAVQSIPLTGTCRAVVAGDFNGDNRIDLVASNTAAASPIVVFLNTPGGFVQGQTLSPGGTAASFGGADVNGDGRTDLTFIDSQFRISVALCNGDGTFSLGQRFASGQPSGPLAFLDLNGDGFAEPTLNSANSVRYWANNLGNIVSGGGFAPGNYFMDINIANQTDTTPDPVVQIRGVFNGIRDRLVGTPDAIQTRVIPPPAFTTIRPESVIVELRDWRGQPVNVPVRSISLTREGSGPFATSGSTFEPLGGGRYRVSLTPLRQGTDTMRIVVDAGARPVTLMPMPAIRVANPTLGARR